MKLGQIRHAHKITRSRMDQLKAYISATVKLTQQSSASYAEGQLNYSTIGKVENEIFNAKSKTTARKVQSLALHLVAIYQEIEIYYIITISPGSQDLANS